MSKELKAEQRLAQLGVKIPDILLPNTNSVELEKWAVVACDQYTSEEEYWADVDNLVGDSYSTLRLILPEVYLESPDKKQKIEKITATMKDYLSKEVFSEYKQTAVLVTRKDSAGLLRKGLVLALDLEQYDWRPEKNTLIRATEGTILDRIPPRKEIRKDAPLEFPHILVLIDDPENLMFSAAQAAESQENLLYDFDLMKGSGRLTGYAVRTEEVLMNIAQALETIHARRREKYGMDTNMLFAMGDGNHSLATAKSMWEELKSSLSEEEKNNHPARFALVEIENIHDEGILFEPIHKTLFEIDREKFMQFFADSDFVTELGSAAQAADENSLAIMVEGENESYFELNDPSTTVCAGAVQNIIDRYLDKFDGEVDYIHGEESARNLAKKPKSLSFLLPGISKDTFFKTVVEDGSYPRKTFSMGEADDKRFYMEGRKIL
jgi:hypothetical protein